MWLTQQQSQQWFLALLVVSTAANLALSLEKKKRHVCHPHSLKISSTVVHRPHKLVIAHRGASYHLPEHTLAAYRTALSLGADFIEPDIVASADEELWALHTDDLNKTTNVEQVFGSQKDPWFNPAVNKTSFWIFNFTTDEIKQLRVRQRLPAARSQLYDDLWPVPTLAQVLELLQEWNTKDLVQTIQPVQSNHELPQNNNTPSDLELAQAGLYLELKNSLDYKKINIDLVDLLYQHFDTHWDLWEPLVVQCYSTMKFNQYKVPGFVLQSFDVEALQDFHDRWPTKFVNPEVPTDSQNYTLNETRILAPEPPYVILVNYHGCTGRDGDRFWVRMTQSWSFLSGVGCDKNCLLDTEGEEFASQAREHDVVFHPWTERPETTFVSPDFASVMAETQYLLCHRHGVEGIFSESVTHALIAARLGCDSDLKEPTPPPLSTASAQGKFCYENEAEAGIYANFAFFVMGSFVSSLACFWLQRKRRRRFGEGSAVPTADEYAGELELN